MAKKVFTLFLWALMAHGFVAAQTNMAVPSGSFEQWTTHPGYSVSVIVPVSVYSSFQAPTGWDFPTYPVNETVSMGFFSVNINTDLPLIMVGQDTASVPDGTSAVKLQTFMLSDIISSTVYSMAAGSIDTMLTNMVFPSILATGTMDIEHFVPIMNSLIANMDSVEALLVSLMSEDVNYYFNGGIAMEGFVPTFLTGNYKYHSAVSGDNGGVLILGTRYDSIQGRRVLVGGGANIALSDTMGYTPFTVDYISLHDYDASYPEQTPDSLIVMLVSSASLNRQQGSYLCVDSLTLWHVDPPEPDTCASIVDLTATADIHEAILTWSATDDVEGYELEYGEVDFVQGSGTLLTLTSGTCTLTGLDAQTQYDVWVHSVCSDSIYGEWSMVQFITQQDTCASITAVAIDSSNITFTYEGLAAGYAASWQSTFVSDGWEVEYGLEGFTSGAGVTATVQTPTCALEPLLPDTMYELRVRSVCSDSIYGEWASVIFMTMADTTVVDTTTQAIMQLSNQAITIFPNPASGHCVVSLPEGLKAELRLYSVDGRLLQTFVADDRKVALLLPEPGVFLLQVVTEKLTFSRKIVNK